MTHVAIARWTEQQMQRSPAELRAEIEASEREIRSGWIGISDWLLAYKPRKPKPRPKPKPKPR